MVKMYNIKVHVILKDTVNDPQGHTINRALIRLGFDTISSVRSGKYFEIKINETNEDKVMEIAESICSQLLANPVIEKYNYTIEKILSFKVPLVLGIELGDLLSIVTACLNALANALKLDSIIWCSFDPFKTLT